MKENEEREALPSRFGIGYVLSSGKVGMRIWGMMDSSGKTQGRNNQKWEHLGGKIPVRILPPVPEWMGITGIP